VPKAYYNENDPKAAAWLRELIGQGLIAPGDVDERSILDVKAKDLKGYTQCHFFAGIGVWSHALRQAGWPDSRKVWTGSCPCQGFSTAGRQLGFKDPRHLWPAWFGLIKKCRPDTVFGEQVAAAVRHGWLDLVQSDLEGIGYAVAAAVVPACSFGAPHIRQRLYFVAESKAGGLQAGRGNRGEESQARCGRANADRRRSLVRVADAPSQRALIAGEAQQGRNRSQERVSGKDGQAGRLGHPRGPGLPGSQRQAVGTAGRGEKGRAALQPGETLIGRRPGPTNGFWGAADWLFCKDGKWRPVEPGTFPLADGAPARVGRLRGTGNALTAQAAEAFIGAYLES